MHIQSPSFGRVGEVSTKPTRYIVLSLFFFWVEEYFLGVVKFDEFTQHEKPCFVAYAGSLLHVVRNDHYGVIIFQLENQFFDF